MAGEQSPFFIKHSPERKAIAEQIRKARTMERRDKANQRYEMDRGMRGYESALYGLSHFLDYARSLDMGGLILDLGAGTTRGTAEISESPKGQGLSFIATGLSMSSDIENYIGEDNYRNTSVETLREVENNSVAGIMAVNSLAYSAEPGIAIRRIDEVLVPGGVLKASFLNRKKIAQTLVSAIYNLPVFQTGIGFIDVLQSLGYDVAMTENADAHEVIVAIKPGGKRDITAEQLLARDKHDLDMLNVTIVEGLKDLVSDDRIQTQSVTDERLLSIIRDMLDNIGIPYDEQAIDLTRASGLFVEIERVKQELSKRNPDSNVSRLGSKK